MTTPKHIQSNKPLTIVELTGAIADDVRVSKEFSNLQDATSYAIENDKGVIYSQYMPAPQEKYFV